MNGCAFCGRRRGEERSQSDWDRRGGTSFAFAGSQVPQMPDGGLWNPVNSESVAIRLGSVEMSLCGSTDVECYKILYLGLNLDDCS